MTSFISTYWGLQKTLCVKGGGASHLRTNAHINGLRSSVGVTDCAKCIRNEDLKSDYGVMFGTWAIRAELSQPQVGLHSSFCGSTRLGILCSAMLVNLLSSGVFSVSFMNNQKQQKPTLTGQRFKTRKRGLSLSPSLSRIHSLIHLLSYNFPLSPRRWKGEIWPYSVSRKYCARLESIWHWFGSGCEVPWCLWRKAWLPPVCRDTLRHPGGRWNAGWVHLNLSIIGNNSVSVLGSEGHL